MGLIGLSLILAMTVAEVVIRTIAPQQIFGPIRTIDETGLVVNKKWGRANASLGHRKVTYATGANGERIPADDSHYAAYTEDSSRRTTVLFVGDSNTFGYLLDYEDTFVGLLQSEAVGFNWINGAVMGYGLEDITAYLQKYCEVFQPDYVLYMAQSSDLARSTPLRLYEIRNGALIRNSKPEEVLTLGDQLKVMLDRIAPYQWIAERSQALAYVRRQLALKFRNLPEASPGFGNTPLETKTHAGTLTTLGGLFLETSDRCGAETVLVDLWSITGSTDEELSALWTLLGVSPLTLSSSEFAKIKSRSPEELIIAGDGHPNERANRLIAAALIDSVIGQGTLTSEQGSRAPS